LSYFSNKVLASATRVSSSVEAAMVKQCRNEYVYLFVDAQF
jgi:hypothetical protein